MEISATIVAHQRISQLFVITDLCMYGEFPSQKVEMHIPPRSLVRSRVTPLRSEHAPARRSLGVVRCSLRSAFSASSLAYLMRACCAVAVPTELLRKELLVVFLSRGSGTSSPLPRELRIQRKKRKEELLREARVAVWWSRAGWPSPPGREELSRRDRTQRCIGVNAGAAPELFMLES